MGAPDKRKERQSSAAPLGGLVMSKFQFGNVVVVDDEEIGVIVKSWADGSHDVYVRSYNCVRVYPENEIKHFIYSKTLSEDERKFYS